jgi:hypothetical protein
MKYRICLLPLVFCLSAGALNADTGQSASFTAHGALQFDAATWYAKRRSSDSIFSFAGMNMLTLNVKSTNLKSAKIEGLVDIAQLYGMYAGRLTTSFGPLSLPALSTAPLIADLRMLYGSLYLPFADITFGRQIVNLGKGAFFSPVDQFSSVDITELSFKRRGSDIVMASVPLGTVSGIDAVTELPTGNDDRASALQVFTNASGWDIAGTGIYRHRTREVTGGIAAKGDALIGITGECIARYNRSSKKMRFEAMTGIDYSISQTWLFAAEYYYRSSPSDHFLFDKHNLFGTVQYTINDLMSLSSFVISALPAANCCATVQYAWNLLQGVTTSLYVRYWRLDEIDSPLPDCDAGVRVSIRY